MALADYRADMETCCRCSACKFIPFEKVKGVDFVNACPSISRYNFQAYSGTGRLNLGVAVLEKKFEYTPKLLEVIYNCQMCGACDVSCKYAMDMDVLEPINALRIDCVEKGHTLPVLDKMAASLRKGGPMVVGSKVKGSWFKELKVKDYTREKCDVIYHAGCRTAYDSEMWPVAQNIIKLMQKAGADVGIAGTAESCCGGRAYQMGYRDDFLKNAERYMKQIKKSGAKTLVTGCAECYYAFKVLYDRFNLKGKLEVLHTSEYFARLIKGDQLKLRKKVDLKVTYHDPCHLGRLGEPYIHWKGKRKDTQMILFDPPKEFQRGTYGVYEPPRDILKAVPGLSLVEMDRTKEYAWCCGAGGGVMENNPDFAEWTAKERIREAVSTGAKAIVTACPGCEKNFSGASGNSENSLKVYDLVTIIAAAAL